jgi:hypothetical protein
MCLTTKQLFPKYAFNDIECDKWLHKCPNGDLRSPIRPGHHIWERNKIYKTKITRWLHVHNGYFFRIEQGFHACVKGEVYAHGCTMYKVIVPKGSWYYMSYDGSDIVANQMMLIG